MNGTFKKIFNYIIIGIFIGALFWTGSAAYYNYRRYTVAAESLEQYMGQLESARQRNAEYAAIYSAAKSTNRELGECLSRTTTTLSELRSQLQEVARRYNEMENLLNCIGNYNSDLDSYNGSTDSNISE